MLTGLKCGFGPMSMQAVRHSYVDGVDARVREQLCVGPVCGGDLVLSGEPAGAFKITCRDSSPLSLRPVGRGLHHRDRCDPRCPKNPDADSCVRVTRGRFSACLMHWFSCHVTPWSSRTSIDPLCAAYECPGPAGLIGARSRGTVGHTRNGSSHARAAQEPNTHP